MTKAELLDTVWAIVDLHCSDKFTQDDYFDMLEDLRIEAGIRAEEIMQEKYFIEIKTS